MNETDKNPIIEIEDQKAWRDFGKMGALVYQGALEETNGNTLLALSVTAAYFRGLVGGANDTSEDKDQT